MCLLKQRSAFSDYALHAPCAVIPLWIIFCTGLLRVAGLPAGRLPRLSPGHWELPLIIQRSGLFQPPGLWHRLSAPDLTRPDSAQKGCTSFQVRLEIVAG